ncbi:unnamed protein product [Auanema sp. JU1783]|nr:unnamed protein product [Auanema sp. JU1783]
MVEVKFTLLRGEESYQSYTMGISSEISYDGVQDYINLLFRMFFCNQQIYFRGEEMPIVEHPLKSVEDGEEISIKHFMWVNWVRFKQHSHNAWQAIQSESEESLVEHVRLAALVFGIPQRNF